MTRYTHARYHPLQVSLRWLAVILVFATFLPGKNMSSLPNESTEIVLIGIHMALGLTTLVVIVIRFIARMRLPGPTVARTGNAFFDSVGKVVHTALYLLVFLMAVSGLSLSMQSGLTPIVVGRSGTPLPADFYDFTARVLHGMAFLPLLYWLWYSYMWAQFFITSSPSRITCCPAWDMKDHQGNRDEKDILLATLMLFLSASGAPFNISLPPGSF